MVVSTLRVYRPSSTRLVIDQRPGGISIRVSEPLAAVRLQPGVGGSALRTSDGFYAL